MLEWLKYLLFSSKPGQNSPVFSLKEGDDLLFDLDQVLAKAVTMMRRGGGSAQVIVRAKDRSNDLGNKIEEHLSRALRTLVMATNDKEKYQVCVIRMQDGSQEFVATIDRYLFPWPLF